MKKKMMMVVVGLVAVVASGLLYLTFFPAGQRPDSAFDLTVRNPAYTDRHPLILFDEGHYNSHTSDGGYAPFAKLMRNDG
ncbi:MAG: hypothetical protein ABI878_15505, partial [Acidobacteriota bacterium]